MIVASAARKALPLEKGLIHSGAATHPGQLEGVLMKVVVNRSLCDGNGNCAAAAPEIFALDDDDQLEVLRESFGEELRDKVEAAVRSCPKNALSLSG